MSYSEKCRVKSWKENAFEIGTDKEAFYFFTDTEKEKDKWIGEICRAMINPSPVREEEKQEKENDEGKRDGKMQNNSSIFGQFFQGWKKDSSTPTSSVPSSAMPPTATQLTHTPSNTSGNANNSGSLSPPPPPTRTIGKVEANDFSVSSSPPPAPLVQAVYRYDAFLTHDWGKDEDERDNHKRVSRVNAALKARGINTWFDEDRLDGNIRHVMAEAIAQSKIVVTFITGNYRDKVNSGKGKDNCFFEFNYASNYRSDDIQAVVMEKRMRDPRVWGARLGAELGGCLYVDMVEDDPKIFNQKCDELANRIRMKIETKESPQFAAPIATAASYPPTVPTASLAIEHPFISLG